MPTSANSDILGPQVESISPAPGSVDVSVNAQTHIRFDEPINPVSLYDVKEDSMSTGVYLSTDNRQVRIIRVAPHAENTEVTVVSPIVEDYAGNAGVAFNSTCEFRFS